jgi:hypothetical protein
MTCIWKILGSNLCQDIDHLRSGFLRFLSGYSKRLIFLSLAYSSTLKMEVARSTWRHISEDGNLLEMELFRKK